MRRSCEPQLMWEANPTAVRKGSNMRNFKTALFGILVVSILLAASAAPVAAGFYHSRGILMTTYPQHVVIFWGGPGYYEETLAVVILPPWYFVDDLMGFDSVTLTITLVGSAREDCPLCSHSGDPIRLLGADAKGVLVINLGSVSMSEEDNGALLVVPVTFIIDSSTGTGWYMLYLSAEAHSSLATFVGWDQVPVSIYPGLRLG